MKKNIVLKLDENRGRKIKIAKLDKPLIKIEDIKNRLIKVLGIKSEDIEKIKMMGGMTNKNYLVIINKKKYVLRIPGFGTSNMINRINEKQNLKKASIIGIDKELVYFNSDTGIKISALIEGAITMNSELSRKKENMILIAEILKKLHTSKLIFDNRFDVFEEIEKYEKLIKDKNNLYGRYQNYIQNREKIFALQNKLKNYGLKIAPCHNDTVPENFVKNNKGRMFLIDWEYSGMYDPMWDLAAHSLEVGFTEKEEKQFLGCYFKDGINSNDKKRIEIYKILQDFLWSIWTVLKEENGDDFGNYGVNRYLNGIDRLEKLED